MKQQTTNKPSSLSFYVNKVLVKSTIPPHLHIVCFVESGKSELMERRLYSLGEKKKKKFTIMVLNTKHLLTTILR